MVIHLEVMEIVWLQNINRQPGEYQLSNQNGHIVNLVECGLVRYNDSLRLYITERGKEVLKRHLPLSICGQDYNKVIAVYG